MASHGGEHAVSEVWKCNCPICRLFVHPILRKLAPPKTGGGGKKNVTELAKGRPVEVVKLSEINQETQQAQENNPQVIPPPTPTPPTVNASAQGQAVGAPPATPPPQAPQTAANQGGGGGSEERKEEEKEEKQTIEVTVPREVLERIEVLEGEVDKIKKYVKASVEGIKATLVDLRSAMAELSNPFNILRKYADIFLSEEKGGKEGGGSKEGNGSAQSQLPPYPQIIPVIVPMQQPIQSTMVSNNQQLTNASGSSGQSVIGHPLMSSKDSVGREGGIDEDVSKLGKEESRVRITPDLYQKLAQWVNSMLEKVSIDKFMDLIDNYVAVGVIDKDVGEVLKRIASTINDLKSAGLSIDEQAKSLKELLDALGVSKEEIETGVMKAVKKAKEAVESSEKESEKDAASELLELISGGGGG